ncbi:hypothetical protein ACPDXS_002786 [Vibrio cholerae]
MDFSKLWAVISANFKIGLSGLVLGGFITYLAYDTFVLVSKDSEIASLNAAVEVEKGNQKVLEQRLKLLGDRVSFLNERLEHKPKLEKEKVESLEIQVESLAKENSYLKSLKSKLESVEGKEIDIAKLELQLDSYISKNRLLKATLANYESEIIVENYLLNQGQAWTGLGGKVSFGIGYVDYTTSGGNFALATSTIFPGETRQVKAGERFEFEVKGNKYYLIITSVKYIGSTAEISVYKM